MSEIKYLPSEGAISAATAVEELRSRICRYKSECTDGYRESLGMGVAQELAPFRWDQTVGDVAIIDKSIANGVRCGGAFALFGRVDEQNYSTNNTARNERNDLGFAVTVSIEEEELYLKGMFQQRGPGVWLYRKWRGDYRALPGDVSRGLGITGSGEPYNYKDQRTVTRVAKYMGAILLGD